MGRFVRILVEDIDKSKKRAKRFLGWLIFAIISAVTILASATAAVASLTQSVKTAHEVSEALTNVTKEFQIQEKVDEEVLSRLQALEATVMWLGDRQEALKTRVSLPCDWEHVHKSLCVTPLPWNSSQHDWSFIRRHLMGAFDLSLQQNIQSLHDQLQDQIHRLQELTSQSVFDRLEQDLSWINPKNWFNGLNLRMSVFIGIGAGRFILFLVFLQVLRSAILLWFNLAGSHIRCSRSLTPPTPAVGRGENRKGKSEKNSWVEIKTV